MEAKCGSGGTPGFSIVANGRQPALAAARRAALHTASARSAMEAPASASACWRGELPASP
eukprot:5817642-Lingulodinium_polyedra.AAC.1